MKEIKIDITPRNYPHDHHYTCLHQVQPHTCCQELQQRAQLYNPHWHQPLLPVNIHSDSETKFHQLYLCEVSFFSTRGTALGFVYHLNSQLTQLFHLSTWMNSLEKEEAFKSNCTKDFIVDWFLSSSPLLF